MLHSHSYRFAEPFAGQSVIVLGAKASGLDISLELADVGAQVTTNICMQMYYFYYYYLYFLHILVDELAPVGSSSDRQRAHVPTFVLTV